MAIALDGPAPLWSIPIVDSRPRMGDMRSSARTLGIGARLAAIVVVAGRLLELSDDYHEEYGSPLVRWQCDQMCDLFETPIFLKKHPSLLRKPCELPSILRISSTVAILTR